MSIHCSVIRTQIVCFLILSLLLLTACSYSPAVVAEPTPIQATPGIPPAPLAITHTAAATSQPASPSPAFQTATATASPLPTATPSSAASPLPDPLAVFTAALRPAFVGDIAAQQDLPRYRLQLWISPAEQILTGTEQIDLRNMTAVALADIALRLYPNFPRDLFGKGGDVRMTVTSVSAEQQRAQFNYAAQDTAVLVPLPQSLAPGARTTLQVSFTATLQPWSDGSWPLPSYYPLLAMREGANWRLDVTQFPDRVFSESAWYAAEITVPSDVTVVASGSTLDVQGRADGSTTYTIVTGPIRQFALTLGNFVVS